MFERFAEKIFSEKDLDLDLFISDISMNTSITPEFIERHLEWKWDMAELFRNLFSKAVLEDKNNYKNKIYLLIGEEDKNSSLYNFKNNFLFDGNLNKIIFNFLCH